MCVVSAYIALVVANLRPSREFHRSLQAVFEERIERLLDFSQRACFRLPVGNSAGMKRIETKLFHAQRDVVTHVWALSPKWRYNQPLASLGPGPAIRLVYLLKWQPPLPPHLARSLVPANMCHLTPITKYRAGKDSHIRLNY